MTSRKLSMLSAVVGILGLAALATPAPAEADPICQFCVGQCPSALDTYCESRGCLQPGPAYCGSNSHCGSYPDNLMVTCAEET